MVFKTTFNNISVISWQSVLLMEKSGVPGENRGDCDKANQRSEHMGDSDKTNQRSEHSGDSDKVLSESPMYSLL
jgi:hypothetical protein